MDRPKLSNRVSAPKSSVEVRVKRWREGQDAKHLKKKKKKKSGSVKANSVHKLNLGMYRKLTKVSVNQRYICSCKLVPKC